MANFIKFTDSVALKPVKVDEKVRDFFLNSNPSPSKPLRVRIAATHSGRITRNNSFYLPDRMRTGTPSWTAQYPKPVLVHHESKEDPIGRVVEARYIDISTGLRDSWKSKEIKDSFERPISDTLLDAFIKGTLSKKEIFDIATNYFINDLRVSDDPDFEGLGYIELVAEVTDPEAIKKILDGRYLTGSVGASTDSAVCSICKVDWAGEDGPCEHSPGKSYDDKKCVLIAGDFVYDEYSFVNKPADTMSRVIEVNVGGIQDFVKIDTNGKIPETTLILLDNVEEDNSMSKFLKLEDAMILLQKDGRKLEKEEAETIAKAVLDHVEKNDLCKADCEKEDVFMAVLDELYPVPTNDNKDQQKDVGSQGTTSIEDFFGEEYQDLIGDDPWGPQYVEMIFDILNGEDKDLAQELKDKKLSAAARKKLPKSVFCKPPDGYPVQDCAHAKAAMAYAKKYNESSSVVSCIRRKASRLGCPFGDDSKEKKDFVDVGEFVVGWFDSFEDEELLQLAHGLLDVFKERKIEFVLEDDSKKDLQELKDKLEASKKENSNLQQDIENLQDSLVQVMEDQKNHKVKRIADFKQLAGEEIDLTKLQDEFSEKSMEDCDKILEDYAGKVDIGEISNKIKSGLANIPEGTVPDPTLTQDNSHKNGEVSKELLDKIMENYTYYRMKYNQTFADNYLERVKAEGIIPKNYPLKDIDES